MEQIFLPPNCCRDIIVKETYTYDSYHIRCYSDYFVTEKDVCLNVFISKKLKFRGFALIATAQHSDNICTWGLTLINKTDKIATVMKDEKLGKLITFRDLPQSDNGSYETAV